MKPLGTNDPVVIGPYRLLGVLGSGGMGRVYLGTSNTGRRVAIKIIRPDLAEDPVFRARFAREVAAARLVSPLFTAAVVDADTLAPEPWLATTYIDGIGLDRQVLAHGPLRGPAVLDLAAGVAEALTSIHGAGLVHRDLKPSNILLNATGPHIIDFGLALAPEHVRMTTSLVFGTPSYMAPERLRGEEAGPPSDIFSLGATLVFASTGRDLVEDGTVYEQVLQIAQGRFDLSGVPAEVRSLVVRCVSFEPRDRPTAPELTRIVVALKSTGVGIADPAADLDGPTSVLHTTLNPHAVAHPPSPPPGRSRPGALRSVIRPRASPSWDSGDQSVGGSARRVPARAGRGAAMMTEAPAKAPADAAVEAPADAAGPLDAPVSPSGMTPIRPLRQSRISRRSMLGVGGGVAAAVVLGGVAVAAKSLLGNVHGRPTPTGPLGSGTPTPSSVPTHPPVHAGVVIWQAASGAPASTTTWPAGSAGRQVLVTASGLIVTAAGNTVTAAHHDGGPPVWQGTTPDAVAGMWLWGSSVLVSDSRTLTLFDADKGGRRPPARYDPRAKGALPGAQLLPGQRAGLLIVNAVALSETRAFLVAGTLLIAIGRDASPQWSRPLASQDTWFPTAADATHVLVQTMNGSVARLDAHFANTGDLDWSSQGYAVDPNAGTGQPGPPPPQHGGGQQQPPPGPGGHDPAWYNVEARISGGYVLARAGSDVRGFEAANGAPTALKITTPRPTTSIEATSAYARVASDVVVAYDLATGGRQWTTQVRGARMAVTATTLIAAGDHVTQQAKFVIAVSLGGVQLWTTELPPVGGSDVDMMTTTSNTAYLTFDGRGSQGGAFDDVFAIALDDTAHG